MEDLVFEPLTSTEYLQLKNEYISTLKVWLSRELSLEGVSDNKIILEVLVANVKIMESATPEGKEMMDFIFKQKMSDLEKAEDKKYTMSRIADLLIHIQLSFPEAFLAKRVECYYKTLDQFDVCYVKKLESPIVPLLFDLQYIYRYYIISE